MQPFDLLRLATLVFVAVSCIVLGDTAGKMLTARGVDPLIVAWSRFVLAALIFLPFAGLTRPELRNLLNARVIMRAGFIASAICCILTALRTEPIANVYGAFFLGPGVSYLLAIVFLGERPSHLRSVLIALGFIGVLLVVKPGFGASLGMGLALLAGVLYGAYLAMTRIVAGRFRPRFLLFSQLLAGSVLLTPLGMSVPLPALTLPISTLLLASALSSAVGNFLLVLANRQAEASLIAPLIYTQLISATLAGILVFGDWPDALSLLGLVLITASGLATLVDSSASGDQARRL